MGCESSSNVQVTRPAPPRPADNFDHPVPVYKYNPEKFQKQKHKFIN